MAFVSKTVTKGDQSAAQANDIISSAVHTEDPRFLSFTIKAGSGTIATNNFEIQDSNDGFVDDIRTVVPDNAALHNSSTIAVLEFDGTTNLLRDTVRVKLVLAAKDIAYVKANMVK